MYAKNTAKILQVTFVVWITTGCSKRLSREAAGESKPEAYPLGYVEDFDEPRTKLADFSSILLGLSDVQGEAAGHCDQLQI